GVCVKATVEQNDASTPTVNDERTLDMARDPPIYATARASASQLVGRTARCMIDRATGRRTRHKSAIIAIRIPGVASHQFAAGVRERGKASCRRLPTENLIVLVRDIY